MKVIETPKTYKIHFNNDDFNRGIAYRIMAYIKNLPRREWEYSPNDKTWEIPRIPAHLRAMGNTVKDLLPEGVHLFINPNDFDTDEWLDNTFGAIKSKHKTRLRL